MVHAFEPELPPVRNLSTQDSAPEQRAIATDIRRYGTVTLDTLRMGTEAGAIAEAVVQHLSSLAGAEVTVALDIQAHLPDGAPARCNPIFPAVSCAAEDIEKLD